MRDFPRDAMAVEQELIRMDRDGATEEKICETTLVTTAIINHVSRLLKQCALCNHQ